MALLGAGLPLTRGSVPGVVVRVGMVVGWGDVAVHVDERFVVWKL